MSDDLVLPPHGKPKQLPAPQLACLRCNEPTLWATLSVFGARCRRCYDEYCQNPTRLRPLPAGAVIPADVPPMHRWAYRLMARRAAGERLSPAQLHCLAEFERRQGSGTERSAAP